MARKALQRINAVFRYAVQTGSYHSKATVHGFRAVFSTMANEKGFDGDVIEKALAHEQRNKVRILYITQVVTYNIAFSMP